MEVWFYSHFLAQLLRRREDRQESVAKKAIPLAFHLPFCLQMKAGIALIYESIGVCVCTPKKEWVDEINSPTNMNYKEGQGRI